MEALRRCWFPVAQTRQLGKQPLAVALLGEPLVLFRDADGQVALLRDRCPHRFIPLSLGRVEAGQIRCAYHGWTFDGSGRCTDVPSLPRDRKIPRVCVPRYAVRTVDGTIWATLAEQPYEPAPPGWLDAALPGTVRAVDIECDYVRILENLLDNAHAAFVHKNLLRSYPKQKVRAVLRETARGLRVETEGERAERSLLFRLWRQVAAGSDLEVVHVEEYLEPNMARVEYGDRAGRLRIAVQFACIPQHEHSTRLVYRCAIRAPLASRAFLPLVALSVGRLMSQDRVLLEQESSVARSESPGARGTPTASDAPGVWVARSARDYAAHGPRERTELRASEIEYLL